MKLKIAAVIAALIIATTPAAAQTFPAPSSNAPTVVCLWINSTVTINGTAIGPGQACFALDQQTTLDMISAYTPACQTPANPSCTVAQVLATISQSTEGVIAGVVGNYRRAQAQQNVVAPTAVPLQ